MPGSPSSSAILRSSPKQPVPASSFAELVGRQLNIAPVVQRKTEKRAAGSRETKGQRHRNNTCQMHCQRRDGGHQENLIQLRVGRQKANILSWLLFNTSRIDFCFSCVRFVYPDTQILLQSSLLKASIMCVANARTL